MGPKMTVGVDTEEEERRTQAQVRQGQGARGKAPPRSSLLQHSAIIVYGDSPEPPGKGQLAPGTLASEGREVRDFCLTGAACLRTVCAVPLQLMGDPDAQDGAPRGAGLARWPAGCAAGGFHVVLCFGGSGLA